VYVWNIDDNPPGNEWTVLRRGGVVLWEGYLESSGAQGWRDVRYNVEVRRWGRFSPSQFGPAAISQARASGTDQNVRDRNSVHRYLKPRIT
jgi:hypothetical protein